MYGLSVVCVPNRSLLRPCCYGTPIIYYQQLHKQQPIITIITIISFRRFPPILNQSLKYTLGPVTCDLLVSRIGNLEAPLLLCRVSHILHRGSYCISTVAIMGVSAGVLCVWRVIRLSSVVCRGVHYQRLYCSTLNTM